MGRITEFLVALNAIGGITAFVVGMRARARRQARAKQVEKAQAEVDRLKEMG